MVQMLPGMGIVFVLLFVVEEFLKLYYKIATKTINGHILQPNENEWWVDTGNQVIYNKVLDPKTLHREVVTQWPDGDWVPYVMKVPPYNIPNHLPIILGIVVLSLGCLFLFGIESVTMGMVVGSLILLMVDIGTGVIWNAVHIGYFQVRNMLAIVGAIIIFVKMI